MSEMFYHPLENIEDVDIFERAVERKKITPSLNENRPYVYFTAELYDQENGFRGGGGLGVLAADTRREAERMGVPFCLITPFYPYEYKQGIKDGEVYDTRVAVDYAKFGFRKIDAVHIKCNGDLCWLDVIEKKFRTTRIVAITEPNFRELYAGMSGSDHRLYQEVSLGFGGYAALKLLGLKPAVIQLNEVATFFAALARLDELVRNGMDFYEAVVYTRKHTLYTNHTLVQAAEAEFSSEQFERFVMPNLKSPAVKKWLRDKFENGRIKLSAATIEIAEMKNGVSKLHARVANYKDVAGDKVKFKAITNGIDMHKWVLPATLKTYEEIGVINSLEEVAADVKEKLEGLTIERIRELKWMGREKFRQILKEYPDQNGRIVELHENDFVFAFKRRFVDYKRPEMPFMDLERLKNILMQKNAYYLLAGRVHAGDERMSAKLKKILDDIESDEFLKEHVHYLPDYDEKLAFGMSVGCDATINIPIVGLEACGTSWMKDVANLNILISTHDGGVADGDKKAYLNVSGRDETEEREALYDRMEEAIRMADNDFELEYSLRAQLAEFLPVVSGARMLEEYLDYLFHS